MVLFVNGLPLVVIELKNFVCFSGEGHDAVKILAGYHQYFALRLSSLD